jgi:TolB-like protein
MQLDKMAETIEAFALVIASRVNSTTPASKPVEPLLAVLPFDNLSTDPEMQFFSDGVAEEIMQTLMRSAGLKVIGRTSAFQFRGERKSLAAQALKATHILDGNVRRSGARMRVSAQLTDAGTGTALWGERYDREVSDAFALQDEIAGQVATALNRKLSTARADAEGIDPLAYDLFMKAQPALTANDMAIAKAAIPLFETVVSRAPRFATGWGALAFARAASMSKSLDAEHDVNYRATVEANNRSIELEAASTLSLLTQTALLPAFSSHARKIALCKEALKTEPNNPLVLQMLVDAYFSVGHLRKALDIATKVVEIDPMSGPGYVMYSEVLRQCGRQQEALVALQIENEASVRGRWWVPRAQWNIPYFDDDLDGADAFLAENESRFADAPNAILPALRSATRILRMPINERRATMRHILGVERDRPISLETCGFAARADCTDEAYEALFTALESGKPIVGAIVNANAGSLRTFACGQLFGEISGRLRQDLRFPRLCAAFGLVDYWRESGQWPDCVAEVANYYDFRAECEKAAMELGRA